MAGLTAALTRIAAKLGLLAAARGIGALTGIGRRRRYVTPSTMDRDLKRDKARKTQLPGDGTVITTGKNGSKPRQPKQSQGKISKAAGNVGAASKSLVKRFPWLSAVLAGTTVANNELDPTLTRKEKTVANGQDLGRASAGLGGAAMGAAIGTAIVPGIGTAVGAIIGGIAGDYFAGDAGEVVGGKVGEWVHNLNIADVPGDIKSQFGSWVTSLLDTKVGQYLKERWDEGIEAFKEGLNTVNQWIKEKTGVDVGVMLEKAGDVVNEYAKDTGEWVSDKAKSASDWMAEKLGISNTNSKTTNTSQKPVEPKTSKRKDDRWNTAREDIVNAADAAGVDPGVLAAIAHFESGFNPNAQPIAGKKRKHLNKVRQFDGTMAISSAHGYGQFLDGTWTDYLNKYGAKYGVEGAGKLTKKQAAQYRNDTKIQAAILAEFTRENVERGKRLGGADDVANVYALHNLGSGDGGKFLKALNKNPNAPVSSVLSDRVINGNTSLYGDGQITVGKAYARMGKKMRQGEKYAQDARAYAATQRQPKTINKTVTPNVAQSAMKPRFAQPMNPRVAMMNQVMPMPKVANLSPPAIKIEKAEPIYIASKKDKKPVVQSQPIPDVDKHVSDPVIAHAISGGMGFGSKNNLLGS